ncbi:endoplasmic reticulum-Golgi intermediate compartment protein 2 isoform X2 [Parasteatoda tepidariorum]|uniref:endoplasmic reticulum-Golgi intermediate compartment protein 2 isoform X2 n=1 Tax=Parasteatoda tepidariorum TaxID=114398 RepID=UPI000A2BFDE4|nr:endoplasmic reticulum-Golgi intermediate compartment protein 2 [Parasteatoda tepidariorum]XP_042896914.1 endoplasmic reticulum-Golgi intermediate compartment protein 2 [Parasteatoda tepidariorum]
MRRNIQRLKHVEEIDIFPKVPEDYKKTTATGGTVTIISFITIFILVCSEIVYYSSSQLKFQYGVDHDIDSKLQINVDLTVAMPCSTIGADILDVTNQNADSFGELEEEPTVFELPMMQRAQFDTLQKINLYIREEYHAIQDLIWKNGYTNILKHVPTGDAKAKGTPDACRLKGSLVVNKVAGNFHITAGKHIPHPAGHAHISAFLKESDYNFSHRIEQFSFGEPSVGVFEPLEGDEKIASSNFHLYQYYLKIVPTEIIHNNQKQNTYQYSVTEQARPIDHKSGSHGVPGIYFKYDMSFVKVKVSIEKHSIWRFVVRLCGIVGGVFATSGIVSALFTAIVDYVCCKRNQTRNSHRTIPATNLSVINLINDENLLKTNQAFHI